MQTNADTTVISNASGQAPDLRDSFRPIRALLAVYIALGLVGLAVTLVFRNDQQLVNTAVWVRTTIVLITSVATYLLAQWASAGARRAFLRVRIISFVVPLAIVILIVLPDPFPVWMKAQQGLCALTVAGVAVLVNRRSLRRYFSKRP